MLACTARSRAVGIPSVRSLPFAFGILRSRTGSGSNLDRLRSSLSDARNELSSGTIWRGLMPSTPAVRAPRLPRTRAQPTRRKAGSQTRLNRSSNRRAGSSVAHWCNLVWILSTLASACSSVGNGAPVFTGDLLAFQSRDCRLAGSLRHADGSPVLGLLRTLRPEPGPSADGAPARPRAGCTGGRATRSGSHVHRVPVDRIGAQLSRCGLAVEYAAGIPRRPPHRRQ